MSLSMPTPRTPARDQDDAWRELSARLHRLARAISGRRAGACDDLVQETIARCLRAGRSPFEFAYARTTLLRVHLDNERSTRRRLARTLRWALASRATRDPDAEHESEGDLDRSETLHAARRALDRLSPMQRSAYLLRVIEGMSYAEIAAALGTTESAAGSSVHAARRRLMESLGKEAST